MNYADIIAEAAGLSTGTPVAGAPQEITLIAWLWLLLSLACTSGGQVAQKIAVQSMKQARKGGDGRHFLVEPWLLVAILLLGVGALFWLAVLQAFPVGVAYPLLASNFAIMALVAKFGFKETISARRWLGVGLIILGVAVLGASA
ncbi:hypothetical protein ACTL6U_08470 [Rhodovibrionaceae bacterium A322]